MWIITALTAAAAGFVRGFTGFGGPAVMTLVLVQFYDPISVLPKVIVIDSVSNLKLLPSTRHEVHWPVAITLTIAILIAAPFGYFALRGMDSSVARYAIAIVAATSTLLLMAGWRFTRMPSLWLYAAVGLIGGFVFGATFIALLFVAFLLASPAPRAQTRANTVICAFVTGLALIVIHFIGGTLAGVDVLRSLLVGVVYLGGAVLGSTAFRATGERDFRRAVLWLLLGLSLASLVSS